MRIRTRLTIYFTALVLLIISVRVIITYTSLSRYKENEFYHRLHAKAITTAILLLKVQNIDSALLKKIDRAQNDLLLGENISIYNSENREIYSNNDTLYYKVSDELFERIRSEGEIRYKEGPYKIIGFNYSDQYHNVVILAGAVDAESDAMLRHLLQIYAIEYLIFIFVITLAGWFFVGKSLEPIAAVILKTKVLSPVEKSERLPARKEKDEISSLIDTFNGLFDKLEESFKHQKNFTANASHELLNPLAKIKSQLQVSLIQNRNNESYRETIKSVLDDTEELIAMINDLLHFSKLESYYRLSTTTFRIDELLFEVCDNIHISFPDYLIKIQFVNAPQNEGDLVINANQQLLSIAVKNIAENACKFSADKSAYVKLMIEDKILVLSITNYGSVIPQNELSSIFEPYYRSPSMESLKGFGIGLALAHRIFKAHKFPFSVQSSAEEGTTFTIRFLTSF
jgi:signal transduction histidine kinase